MYLNTASGHVRGAVSLISFSKYVYMQSFIMQANISHTGVAIREAEKGSLKEAVKKPSILKTCTWVPEGRVPHGDFKHTLSSQKRVAAEFGCVVHSRSLEGLSAGLCVIYSINVCFGLVSRRIQIKETFFFPPRLKMGRRCPHLPAMERK